MEIDDMQFEQGDKTADRIRVACAYILESACVMMVFYYLVPSDWFATLLR